VRIKSLYLFLVVSFVSGLCVFTGWLVALIFDFLHGLGAFAGGAAGVFAGTLLAEKADFFEGATFNTIGRLAICSFMLAILAGKYWELNDTLSVAVGIPGAGLGALLGKYIDRFFIDDPPPKIF
jgi:hypothetical protein